MPEKRLIRNHPGNLSVSQSGGKPSLIFTTYDLTAFIGIGVLAAGICGWLLRKTSGIERILLIVAGFILVYPSPVADALGIALAAGVALWQWRTGPT